MPAGRRGLTPLGALRRRRRPAEAAPQVETAVAERPARPVVQVHGVVRAVVVRRRAGCSTSLVVELDTGLEPVRVVWLGRSSIAGIRPGAGVTVRGRTTSQAGRPALLNPAYELDPSR